MTEANLRVFRHGLDLEREDAQLIHDPGHAVGHHAEVLGTDKHAGGLCQAWQFLHGLLIPVLVVATVEIVVVEAVEGILVLIPESLIDKVVLHADTWVELVGVLTVVHEEHVADESIESVTQVVFVLAFEELLNLALCVKFGLHLPNIVVLMIEEVFFDIGRTLTKDTLKCPVGDEGTRHVFFVEVQSVGLDLLTGHAE